MHTIKNNTYIFRCTFNPKGAKIDRIIAIMLRWSIRWYNSLLCFMYFSNFILHWRSRRRWRRTRIFWRRIFWRKSCQGTIRTFWFAKPLKKKFIYFLIANYQLYKVSFKLGSQIKNKYAYWTICNWSKFLIIN